MVKPLKNANSSGLLSAKERIKQYRLRQKELGRLKREMYLNDSEYETLKFYLEQLRANNE